MSARRQLLALAFGLSAATLGTIVVLAHIGGPGEDSPVRNEGDPLARPDPEIGFAPSRDATTRRIHRDSGMAFDVYTDARGARVGPDRRSAAHPAIVLIGGSYTWGQGVEHRDTFGALLADSLRVDVANFGLGGYGTVQSLQLLERNVDLGPSVVVYGFMHDHLRRNLAVCAPSYGAECVSWSHVVVDGSGVPRIASPDVEGNEILFQRWLVGADEPSLLRRICLGVRKLSGGRSRGSALPSADPAHSLVAMRFLLARMNDVATGAGATLVVLHLPWFGGEPDSAPDALLAALPSDVAFLDLSGAARRYRDRVGLPLSIEGDGHPNTRAHALVAAEIKAFLRAQGLSVSPRRPPSADASS